ncbi:MAG: efflux RND transporter periplasmic adaptor subunit [Heliobacteriaceae bacterium]|nr:efflux RND transporter periplasmic adaptor subunit [Heliobacteriaceae bacterium]
MKQKKIGLAVLACLLLGVAVYGICTYLDSVRFVKTDDARIDGELVRVSPEIAGRVLELRVKEGDLVTAGEPLARLDAALVKSPVAGQVVKKFVSPGELVSPGQRLFLVADLAALGVTARIEETKIRRIAVGQPVRVTVDAFPGQVLSGVVEQVGLAADSTFALLPTTNVAGNFIKVTQRIPVKIKLLDHQGLAIVPGMNVVVKIAAGG